jgi:hypothetical protein
LTGLTNGITDFFVNPLHRHWPESLVISTRPTARGSLIEERRHNAAVAREAMKD